jgi:formamidopyrimidine-DNA glycosylase
MDDGRSLVYDDQRMFGSIGLAKSVHDFVEEHRLGPDALGITPQEFASRAGGSSRAIKGVLLDQHVLAGVGNLYADESLFQAKLHPLAPADGLSPASLRKLGRCIPMVLSASIAAGTDFGLLPDGFLLRAREEGARCPRGNGRLERIQAGGRSSYLCPRCQVRD